MSLSKIEVHLDDDNEFLIEEVCASRGMCVFFFFFWSIDRRDERNLLTAKIFFPLGLIRRGDEYKYTYIKEQITEWMKEKNFHVKQEKIPLRYNEIIIFGTKQSLYHRVNLCNFRI